MAILRVTAQWTGFTGAPGYTAFHFSTFTGGGDAQAAVDRVRTFFDAITLYLPTGVTIQVLGTVEVLDEATGVLTGYLDATQPAPVVVSGASAPYIGPAGAVINWSTNLVRNGRRIRGRTFIVPMRGTAFDSQGTLVSGAITTLTNAANALRGGDFEQELVVWSRPVGGSGGVAAPIVGARVPDLAAVLRSRRD